MTRSFTASRMLSFCIISLLLMPFFSFAQWAGPGTTGPGLMYYNAGNVGIGTTTPDKLFTVNGVAHIGNDLNLSRTDNFGTASIVVDNVSTNKLYLQRVGGGSIDIINVLGSAIGLGGNVIIGVPATGPVGTKLAVWTNTSGDGIYLSHDGSAYGGNSGIVKIHGPSLPQGGWNGITTTGDAGIIYGTANGTTNCGFVITPWASSTSGLRIDRNGNVGICTSDTKTYQLAVNGSAVFNKVVVKPTSTWPDYVFGSEYRLPPLRSVEKYIRTYRRLPGLPSADSVDKQGLDIGNGQAILLKKIEELTLYSIDQEKKLDSQQQEIDAQSREIGELKTMVKKLLASK